MSQCIMPNRNLSQQRQEEQVGGEERNRYPHVHPDQNLSYVVPMCNNEVTELTWENGQISLHGLGGILPKQRDTLESVIHQANSFPAIQHRRDGELGSSMAGGRWRVNPSDKQVEQNDDDDEEEEEPAVKGKSSGGKRVWSEQWERRSKFQGEESACGSASAAFCRDADTTMMKWANSFESPSLKTARTADDDSIHHDCSGCQDGEGTTKGESYKSQPSVRRSHAAAIHNLSERRRRDRINQKMKTLQKLVPNASKTDKASMLDEVIEYLKQLQAQVHMLSNARNLPQMVIPLGMQQQLLLARMGMGMGMGMGMLDVNNLGRNVPHSFPPLLHANPPIGGATPPFVMPPFTIPPVVPTSTPLKRDVNVATLGTSVPIFNDAYNTFLAQQSMNMDFLAKMSALYRQQSSQQTSKKPVSLPLPNDGQRE